MECLIFYYAKTSVRYGCFIVQNQWYDRIHSSYGMIASIAFELHVVFKCEKIQQFVQM